MLHVGDRLDHDIRTEQMNLMIGIVHDDLTAARGQAYKVGLRGALTQRGRSLFAATTALCPGQPFKGRVLRVETTINHAADFKSFRTLEAVNGWH